MYIGKANILTYTILFYLITMVKVTKYTAAYFISSNIVIVLRVSSLRKKPDQHPANMHLRQSTKQVLYGLRMFKQSSARKSLFTIAMLIGSI